MVKVRFYTLLRLQLGIDEVEIDVNEIGLRDLLFKVKEAVDNDIVIRKVLADDGALRRGTNILVNGHNILSLDRLDTVIWADDVVSLFPPGGGG